MSRRVDVARRPLVAEAEEAFAVGDDDDADLVVPHIAQQHVATEVVGLHRHLRADALGPLLDRLDAGSGGGRAAGTGPARGS